VLKTVIMRALRKSNHLSRQLLATNAVRYKSTATQTSKSLNSVLIANRGEIALYDPTSHSVQ
jgi:3-methylcrotonyl-CoA carboxylase alpha subunit